MPSSTRWIARAAATTSPSLSLASKRTYFANLPTMEVRSVTGSYLLERDLIVEVFGDRRLDFRFLLGRRNRFDLNVLLYVAIPVRVVADRQLDHVPDPVVAFKAISAGQHARDVLPRHHLITRRKREDRRIQLLAHVHINDLFLPRTIV